MNGRDSLATGDVIYVRSLHEIEVKELRVGEIIHLGPMVSKEQTRVDAKRVCSGLLVSAAGLHHSAELPHLCLIPIQEFQSAGKEELTNAQDSS